MQRIVFAKVELWVLALVAVLSVLLAVFFASYVLDVSHDLQNAGRIGRSAIAIAEVPQTVTQILGGDQKDMIAFRNSAVTKGAGWTFPDNSPGVAGYELLSRFDGDAMRPVVELVSLRDGTVRNRWHMDPDTVLADARRDTLAVSTTNWVTTRFRPFHPDVTGDGGLIVKDTMAPLFRIDVCGNRVWLNDSRIFHHSTEPDGEGGYWIGTLIEPPSVPLVPPTFHDDAMAHIDTDGRVTAEISLPAMLIRHGLKSMVHPPGDYTDDPLHLNDVQPVLADGPHWKKGDLFLSLRHVSTAILYRPETDEIVWRRNGPWFGQHDIDILDDHRIAVFNNRAFNPGAFGRVDGHSEVLIYDFATDSVTSPWADAMAREDIKALYEGLYTILPTGELVVEDHNSGRVFAFSADGRTLARFINRAGDGQVYSLGWGRYIDEARGAALLAAADAARKTLGCPADPDVAVMAGAGTPAAGPPIRQASAPKSP